MPDLEKLRRSRYALLRTYRRDGNPVDTPIWFVLDGRTLLFRTKVGPKTTRLTRDPRVQVRVCDARGRVPDAATRIAGQAAILAGAEAQQANTALRRRYGWKYNIIPLLKIPGIRNVHSGLPLREKLRRAMDRDVWVDSAMVRIEF
jgi:uncharacterized protein